jgi:hypothetical protein
MLKPVPDTKPNRFNPAARGFQPVYHPGEVNHCPGCGRTHWFIGRLSAECGFCATALPLLDTGMTGTGLFRLHQPARVPADQEMLYSQAA